jgi:hypothetical protein
MNLESDAELRKASKGLAFLGMSIITWSMWSVNFASSFRVHCIWDLLPALNERPRLSAAISIQIIVLIPTMIPITNQPHKPSHPSSSFTIDHEQDSRTFSTVGLFSSPSSCHYSPFPTA